MQYLFGLRRNYVVIPALGLAYGRVPKVANSTIKKTMARAAGLEHLFPDEGYSKDDNWRGKAPDVYLMTARELKQRFPDVYVFSFVREPLARLASCYRSKIVRPKGQVPLSFAREGLSKQTTFPEFVRHACARRDWRCNIHYRAQSHILSHRGELIPDFVGRFETVREDWATLVETMAGRGLELPMIPQRHGPKKPPQMQTGDLFDGDAALMRMARARYARDFDLFYPDARSLT
ncbi:MAG: sulfotransferase family protein [Pseudomonadota bacterium]